LSATVPLTINSNTPIFLNSGYTTINLSKRHCCSTNIKTKQYRLAKQNKSKQNKTNKTKEKEKNNEKKDTN
jgi:hypothetical protein